MSWRELKKAILMYPYPPEPDGVSLQGHYMMKGLKELGVDVMPCDRENNMQKEWACLSFKPDVCIGVGFWADTPGLIHFPQELGVQAVPWFNADGWVANYHDDLNKLPLVVATSNWVKDTYARDGVSGEHVQPCHIGYDPAFFHPRDRDDPKVKKVREMLDIDDDEIFIFTMGGDVTSKGAQEMLRALAKIDSQFPKWKYVMKIWDSFSADDHGGEEKELIKELGFGDKVTHLVGKFSPEFVGILLNACDIYAGPSRLEGFGMIQLEAQACGKPVISINVGGPKDTIVNGKTGFLVDVASEVKLDKEWVYPWMGFQTQHQIEFKHPKTFAYRADIDQLASATLRLMQDENLRYEMGRNGAKHALDKFHYKVTAKRMKDLVEKWVLNPGALATEEIRSEMLNQG
jgi:alpha-maltose-1-phosphate synthase